MEWQKNNDVPSLKESNIRMTLKLIPSLLR